MTPAQAMHDALWDQGLGRRQGWPTEPDDQAKWETLAHRGLEAARILYGDRLRGDALYAATAKALANAYWDITGRPSPSDFDWEAWRAALVPAAQALIGMAKAQPRRAA